MRTAPRHRPLPRLELKLIEIGGFVVKATLLRREDEPNPVRPRRLQGLVVESFGAGSRMAAGREGIALVGTGCGHPESACRFPRKLAPRAVTGDLAFADALQVRHEVLALTRQSPKRHGNARIHELGLMTERSFVVHAGTDQLP